MKKIQLYWLKHSGFKIKYEEKTFYIDPFKIEGDLEKADFVFITHSHFDHCDLESLKLIVKEDTIFFTTFDCNSKITKLNPKEIIFVKPNMNFDKEFFKKYNINFSLKTVFAYNINKEFHPKENNWVGYILNFDNYKIYHVGDSDDIKENYGLNINTVLVPVSGTYVMNAEEAAHFVENLNFEIAIPMHYGTIVGTKEDALKFKKLLEEKGKKAIIPEENKNLLE